MSLTRFDSTIDHRQQEPFSQCCSNATGLSHKYTHLWLKFPFNCHDDAMILYTISIEYNMQSQNSWMKIVGGVYINIFPQNLFPVDSFVIERYHQNSQPFHATGMSGSIKSVHTRKPILMLLYMHISDQSLTQFIELKTLENVIVIYDLGLSWEYLQLVLCHNKVSHFLLFRGNIKCASPT